MTPKTMTTALEVARQAATPTPMECALARIAAGSMQADPRARETAWQRLVRRVTGGVA